MAHLAGIPTSNQREGGDQCTVDYAPHGVDEIKCNALVDEQLHRLEHKHSTTTCADVMRKLDTCAAHISGPRVDELYRVCRIPK